MISGCEANMFGPWAPGTRKAATRVCKPGAMCQNPGFEFGLFLHGLTKSVKASKYGPQCPSDWLEVRCIVTCLYIVEIYKCGNNSVWSPFVVSEVFDLHQSPLSKPLASPPPLPPHNPSLHTVYLSACRRVRTLAITRYL